MAKKPYMPLMMGDWIMGTRGMKAQVKGVYIGLLIYQYDNGYIPNDIPNLNLIEPEVGLVWDILKHKFEEFEPGKLRNQKLEEVRLFWNKQANNGSLGGRPPKNKNPKQNPDNIPNRNLHNDIDIEYNIELKNEDNIIVNTARAILKDFKFSEIKNFDKLRKINEFLNRLNFDGKLDYFAEQYRGYWPYKNQSGDKAQSLETFLEGGWDRENWNEKLKSLTNGKQTDRNSREQSRASLREQAERILNGDQPAQY